MSYHIVPNGNRKRYVSNHKYLFPLDHDLLQNGAKVIRYNGNMVFIIINTIIINTNQDKNFYFFSHQF